MFGPYEMGRAYTVRIEGHPEPVHMISIERHSCAGGGLLLAIDRHDGEIERLIASLNDENRKAQNEN